jgi:hypothetical protein
MVDDAATAHSHLIAGPARPTVRLRGEPYALGMEHGLRLGRDIVRLEREFLLFLTQLFGGGNGGRSRALGIYWVARLLAGATVIRYWPARYREELRGIVAGMRKAGCGGFNLTRLAVINTLDDLAGAWGRRCVACSAFAVRGDSGGIIVGRNLDYQVIPHCLTALNTMFIYHPVGYNPFVSWGWPGYIGVATGINAKRLSLSLLTSPTRDASPLGMSEGLVNRLLLEQTDTPSQAFTRCRTLPRTVGTNLLLATPDTACVIESSRSHLALRSMHGDRLVATNHFQTSEMARWQTEFGQMKGSLLEERYRSLEGSRQRASDLAAKLRVGMTATEAIRLLTAPGLVSSGQVQSLVMDLARAALWVAAGLAAPVCSAGYQPLEWHDLFT